MLRSDRVFRVKRRMRDHAENDLALVDRPDMCRDQPAIQTHLCYVEQSARLEQRPVKRCLVWILMKWGNAAYGQLPGIIKWFHLVQHLKRLVRIRDASKGQTTQLLQLVQLALFCYFLEPCLYRGIVNG